MSTTINYDEVDDVTIELQKERIKRGTDYSFTIKYNTLRIICSEVFKDAIKEAFARNNIEVTKFYTY